MSPSIASFAIMLSAANPSNTSEQGTFVRIRDGEYRTTPSTAQLQVEEILPQTRGGGDITVVYHHFPRAWHGQPLVGGGFLSPLAPINPVTIDAQGKLAFFAWVDGSPRNQGIFLSNAGAPVSIVRGCGDGGGSGDVGASCGDPSPVGGKFAGLFGGTAFTPCINDLGDVLFLADVNGGSYPRGLFLYRASEGDIISVAGVGEAIAGVGLITAVGPGTMNNLRQVAFLARLNDSNESDILMWDGTGVSRYVSVGDAAPGGGTFQILAGESFGFVDGTEIPVGAIPDINEFGSVAFFGLVGGSVSRRGILVSSSGLHEWYLRDGETSPVGGRYIHFWGPILNNADEVAVFADIDLGAGEYSSAWIVGKPGTWRSAMTFYQPIDDGLVYGMAVSRSPMHPLDDCGNIVLWCSVRPWTEPDGDRLVVVGRDGHASIAARAGDTGPVGGQLGEMDAWPSMNQLGVTSLGAFTPGVAPNARFLSMIGNRLGDADHDLAVTLADYVFVPDCMVGPSACVEAFGCRVFDEDQDRDIDLRDMGAFQRHLFEE